VHHHPRLRYGEGQECADRVQGNEAVGDPAEADQEQGGGDGQEPDAGGVDQPPVRQGERARQKVVAGDQPAQAREVD
jgi:hypothetical protein